MATAEVDVHVHPTLADANRDITRPISKPNKRFFLLLGITVLGLGLMFGAWFYQIGAGIGVAGITHPVFWGVEDGWRPGGSPGGCPGLAADPYAAWAWGAFDEDEDEVGREGVKQDVSDYIGGLNGVLDAMRFDSETEKPIEIESSWRLFGYILLQAFGHS